MIWTIPPTLEGLNGSCQNSAVSHLDIVFTEIGEDYLIAEMPVDHRSVQPMRMLHGGVSCVLIETLGSVAGIMCVPEPGKDYVVGTEINASHLRGIPEGGKAIGKVTPARLGRRVQVWSVEITDEAGKLSCVGRLTVQVIRGK